MVSWALDMAQSLNYAEYWVPASNTPSPWTTAKNYPKHQTRAFRWQVYAKGLCFVMNALNCAPC